MALEPAPLLEGTCRSYSNNIAYTRLDNNLKRKGTHVCHGMFNFIPCNRTGYLNRTLEYMEHTDPSIQYHANVIATKCSQSTSIMTIPFHLCTDLVVEKVAWDDLLFWPCHDCMVLPMLGSADRPNHILIRGWSQELRLDFP